MVYHSIVKVLSTQVGITGCGLHLEESVIDCQDRNIKSSTTKVVDEDVSLTANILVKPVGDGSCSGFVDDAEDVHTRDGASILGCLTLRVVKIGRNSNDCICHRLSTK